MKTTRTQLSSVLTRLNDSNLHFFKNVQEKLSALLDSTPATRSGCELALNRAIDELELILAAEGH